MRLPNGYGGVTKLSGRRRRPYIVRKTIGWEYNTSTGKATQKYRIIGYTKTRAEGLQLLAKYNAEPVSETATAKLTFADVYQHWSISKFPNISGSNIQGYKSAYKLCEPIVNKNMDDIRLADLQFIVDTCDKNYPVLKKLNVLFHQLYDYALKNEIVDKDYSAYIDISQYRNKNPNRQKRDRLSDTEISAIWRLSQQSTAQIILMLIYSGVRVSELL